MTTTWKELLLGALESNSHLKHSYFFQLSTLGLNGSPSNRTVVFRSFPSLPSVCPASYSHVLFQSLMSFCDFLSGVLKITPIGFKSIRIIEVVRFPPPPLSLSIMVSDITFSSSEFCLSLRIWLAEVCSI